MFNSWSSCSNQTVFVRSTLPPPAAGSRGGCMGRTYRRQTCHSRLLRSDLMSPPTERCIVALEARVLPQSSGNKQTPALLWPEVILTGN